MALIPMAPTPDTRPSVPSAYLVSVGNGREDSGEAVDFRWFYTVHRHFLRVDSC